MSYGKLLLFLPLLSAAYDVNITNYHSWKSETGPEKPNFLCPDICFTREEHDRCCSCEGKPIWELNPNTSYLPVYVEYINTFGRSKILGNDSNASFHWLRHENGRMNRLPDNLCEYNDTLVTLSLKGNKIQSIEGINCMRLLDYLDVSDTSISFVSNETFSDMPNLRVLIMTNTNIRRLEPNTFMATEDTEIFVTDLSKNDFRSFDISNMFFKRRAYCNITVAGCNITFIETNDIDLSLNESYCGGDFVCADSNINSHPIQMLFGKTQDDLKSMYKYNTFGRFTFVKLDLPCDCNLAELLLGEQDLFKKFYYIEDDNKYTCTAPVHMINVSPLNVFNDSSLLDEFVCPKSNFCPPSCTCIEQPSHYRMVVDCSYQNLTRLPPYLPETIYNIELNCSNNPITSVHEVNYLENITVLDLSGNKITEISDTVPSKLQRLEKLSLTDHRLSKLSRGFSNIDAGKVWFGLNDVPCSCEEKWIRAWRLGSKVNVSNPLLCRTESGVLQAEEAFNNCIDNEAYEKWLTFFILPVIVLIACLVFRFLRFDLSILKNRLGKKKREYRYDIFFLFDDSNEDVTRFALGIYSHLHHQGYECFVPQIHGDVGEVREIQLYRNIRESRSIVTILSMPKDDDVTDEVSVGMNYAWSAFSSNDIENILAVVFDGKFSEQKARFPYLSAMNRFNRVFKVTSRKYSVKQKVEEALPPPSFNKQRPTFLRDINCQ